MSRAGVTTACSMIREGSHHTSQKPAIILPGEVRDLHRRRGKATRRHSL